MTPDPKLWARLEKWLRENQEQTLKLWRDGLDYYIATDSPGWHSGRTFNAALRRFLKGVGA